MPLLITDVAGLLAVGTAELKRLRQENAESRRANSVLKKASSKLNPAAQ